MKNFKMISAGPIGKSKQNHGNDFGVSIVLSDAIIMEGRDQNYQTNMLLNTEMSAQDVCDSFRMFADHIEQNVVNEPALGKLRLAISNKGK